MKIAFIDFTPWDYNIASVLTRPLGGTHSAACYLAPELARLGHAVSYFTFAKTSCLIQGVSCVAWQHVTPDILRRMDFDVVVVLLAAHSVESIRAGLAPRTKLVLWTAHADDQPDVQNLRDPSTCGLYDAIVLVSDWQSRQFQQTLGIPPEKIAILRLAASPAFLQLFPEAGGSPIGQSKADPPLIAYTSTPYRGLDALLRLFPMIEAKVRGTRLKVYSSMKVYGIAEAEERAKYGALYDLACRTPGVDYVGSIPQPELAMAMRGVSLLAYPNCFRETSCIAVTEAMAAGCHVVTSDLAALPETTAGFASLVACEAETYEAEFLRYTVEGLLARKSDENERRRREQVDFIHREYTWSVRAKQWEEFLYRLTAS
jgi:glycosyltransferase involved in cell wall biosynthesis